MWEIVPSIISAATNLFGGKMNADAQAEANKANAAAAERNAERNIQY